MTMAPETARLLLPDGTRLVHIGPHKTGTTSLQAAFHTRRAALAANGVRYAGRNSQVVLPVMAVIGRTHMPYGPQPPPIKYWHDLVREVDHASEPRVVISSEFFSEATPADVVTIVNDLDPSRVHIVVTLRPLARILASQWQQFVQAGTQTAFDDWLVAMFDSPGAGQGPLFWRRHRHDELIARWAAVVGSANVTVIALDDRDHAMVLRVFEGLTGLPAGTLKTPVDRSNRSLTQAEVEAVRAFNRRAAGEELDKPLLARLMRSGAATYMKEREPGPDEPRIETPRWALDRAGEVAREMVDRIAASGVRVVGDLEAMAQVPSGASPADQPAATVIPPDVAARAAVGIVLSAGITAGARAATGANDGTASDLAPDAQTVALQPEPAIALERVPGRQIRAVIVRRGQVAMQRRLHRIRRPRR
jgi:hypothetical protein